MHTCTRSHHCNQIPSILAIMISQKPGSLCQHRHIYSIAGCKSLTLRSARATTMHSGNDDDQCQGV